MPEQAADPAVIRRYVQDITKVDQGGISGSEDIVGNLSRSTGITPVYVISGLQIPSNSQVFVNKNVNAVNDGTTVYTVTTGKTFYMFGCIWGAEGVGLLKVVVKQGSTELFEVLGGTAITAYGQIASASPIAALGSGVVISVTGAGVSNNFCTVYGVEVFN
jgi:hypothetical protein